MGGHRPDDRRAASPAAQSASSAATTAAPRGFARTRSCRSARRCSSPARSTSSSRIAHGAGEVTRVIQGIVTGIGFLGAGVIVKEGFTVRGLTTSASIWVASAIGVVIGAGSYWTRRRRDGRDADRAGASCGRSRTGCPRRRSCMSTSAFDRASRDGRGPAARPDPAHGFTISEVSYRLDDASQSLEYRGVIWSTRAMEYARRSSAACSRNPMSCTSGYRRGGSNRGPLRSED